MTMNHDSQETLLFGGKNLDAWEKEWVRLPNGLAARYPDLRYDVGLLRTRLGDEVMYIGRGIEHRNGALSKRLADFTRLSASARRHYGAEQIFEHRDLLAVDVLVTGSDRVAGDLAKALCKAMIECYRPRWNVRRDPMVIAKAA